MPWWWWPLAFALAALIAFEVNLGVAALPDWVPFATLFTVAAGTLLWLDVSKFGSPPAQRMEPE
ncbi:Protein of uncharacterised function (DUF3093) [Mycobacterium tuberculosis]|nr:Protein of uncharacterised function (DUF3093) [Mycobacterium tuberculosis]